MFPVHELGDNNSVLDSFPVLKAQKAFKQYKGDKKDKVIKYILYLYDMNSDLINEFPNLKERKEAAALEAGFKCTEVKGWESPIDLAIRGKFDTDQSSGIYKMIFSFLMLQKSYQWTEICTLEQEYEEFTRLRWKEMEDEKDKDLLMAAERKNKLREACHDIIESIKQYRADLFGDNEDVAAHTQQLRATSPEVIARM
jgi:hypothetical protein